MAILSFICGLLNWPRYSPLVIGAISFLLSIGRAAMQASERHIGLSDAFPFQEAIRIGLLTFAISCLFYLAGIPVTAGASRAKIVVLRRQFRKTIQDMERK